MSDGSLPDVPAASACERLAAIDFEQWKPYRGLSSHEVQNIIGAVCARCGVIPEIRPSDGAFELTDNTQCKQNINI